MKPKESKESNVTRTFRSGTLIATLILVSVLCLCRVGRSAEESSSVPDVPVKEKVTMVDIGARECIPCKMMAPIMEELEKEFHETGRAAIFFIDVWKNKDQGRKFGIRSIPTQIFYDKEGKEAYRHEGFMDKPAIVGMLKKLGVE
jgi:thioredoxin 1